MMVFNESDLGPFNVNYEQRALTKHGITVSVKPITKDKTIADFFSKMEPRGVDCKQKTRSNCNLLLYKKKSLKNYYS